MQNTITQTSIIDTTLESFPVLAVNALDRLGYSVSRASKQLDQVLAVERLDEQVGRDWWRHEYRVVLNWSLAVSGGIQAEVEIREVKGGGTKHDCQRRADEIISDCKQMRGAPKVSLRQRPHPPHMVLPSGAMNKRCRKLDI